MINSTEILAAAMSLPPEARAQLAEQLLDSLDPAPSAVDVAWGKEIELRIREVGEGRAQFVSHDDAMDLARRRIETKRGT